MSSSNLEREVKLDAGLRFRLPDLADAVPGVAAVALPDARLQATYFDTPDLRLMRWGITLRHRRDAAGGEGAEIGWTLKLPAQAGGVALARRELTWPGKLGPVPAEAVGLVRAVVRGEAVSPVARLTTQRRRVELQGDGGRPLAEVDDDVVSVLDGRRLAARFREVEIELRPDAPSDLLDPLVKRVTAAGAVPGDGRPKVVRAMGTRASLGPDVAVRPLGPDATMAEVVAAAIAAGVTRIIRHDAGVRLGDDAEHVHQARVGTRRLRSDLRTFRSVLQDQWVTEVRGELGWVAGALGEVRDDDVLMARLESEIATLPEADARPAAAILQRLSDQRDQARARLRVVLDSDRYVAVLDALCQAAAAPPLRQQEGDAEKAEPVTEGSGTSPSPNGGHRAGGDERAAVASMAAPSTTRAVVGARGSGRRPAGGRRGADGADAAGPNPADTDHARADAGGADAAGREGPAPAAATTAPGDRLARHVLPRLCRGPWRHLRQAVERLGEDPPDAALHQVRIRAKRIRYAAEAAEPVMGKPARQLAAAAADLQGVLGDTNDAVVAEAWLRRNAQRSSASQALVAGELITLERERRQRGRETWAKAWKAVDRPGLRAWLK